MAEEPGPFARRTSHSALVSLLIKKGIFTFEEYRRESSEATAVQMAQQDQAQGINRPPQA